MADVLMLLEETRAAIRDAERELSEALSAKTEWERKVTYLQWHVEKLKRLYGLTSAAAHDAHDGAPPSGQRLVQARLPVPSVTEQSGNGRPGTVKQALIDVLRENRRPMTATELWAILEKRPGVPSIKSDRPRDVVASLLRSSMQRKQGIFTKDGTKYGLVEWQASRNG